jgi:hypothetical protein
VFGFRLTCWLNTSVVVLRPIAATAALLVALWAWYRHHLGIATLVATFLVTLFVPLTTQSGESLASRLPEWQVIAAHAEAGDKVQRVAALFGLCLLAVIALDLRRRMPATVGLAPAEACLSRRGALELAGGSPEPDVAGPDSRAHLARRRCDRGESSS